METIKRKPTLPKNPKPNAISPWAKQNILEAYIFVQEVPRMHFIMSWQSQILPNQLNNLGLQI